MQSRTHSSHFQRLPVDRPLERTQKPFEMDSRRESGHLSAKPAGGASREGAFESSRLAAAAAACQPADECLCAPYGGEYAGSRAKPDSAPRHPGRDTRLGYSVLSPSGRGAGSAPGHWPYEQAVPRHPQPSQYDDAENYPMRRSRQPQPFYQIDQPVYYQAAQPPVPRPFSDIPSDRLSDRPFSGHKYIHGHSHPDYHRAYQQDRHSDRQPIARSYQHHRQTAGDASYPTDSFYPAGRQAVQTRSRLTECLDSSRRDSFYGSDIGSYPMISRTDILSVEWEARMKSLQAVAATADIHGMHPIHRPCDGRTAHHHSSTCIHKEIILCAIMASFLEKGLQRPVFFKFFSAFCGFFPRTLVCGYIYLSRYAKDLGSRILTVDDLRRAYLSCCILARKYNDDKHIPNSVLVDEWRIDLKELNYWEALVLNRLDYNLRISEREYAKYYNIMMGSYCGCYGYGY